MTAKWIPPAPMLSVAARIVSGAEMSSVRRESPNQPRRDARVTIAIVPSRRIGSASISSVRPSPPTVAASWAWAKMASHGWFIRQTLRTAPRVRSPGGPVDMTLTFRRAHFFKSVVTLKLDAIGSSPCAACDCPPMPNLIKNHSLSAAMFAIFAATLVGLSFTGWQNYNDDQKQHNEPKVDFIGYLKTPDFGEAVFENWESEFLQMGAYVVLTAILIERGSSESKDPDKHEAVDDDPEDKKNDPKAPWPVRQGGIALSIYKHSLTI